MASFRLMAEALAIGMLVGVERYKARKPGEKRFGSVRTFAIISLIGGVCGLLGVIAFTATAFGAIAILVTVGYSREVERSVGLTTEIAALAVFWLGYLVHSHETLAVSATIVLAILLASKQSLHGFVKEAVSERELFDTLKFLAVVLVVYPLLPDRALGPWGFLNPSKIWLLVVLVSTVSYSGYLLVRWLGPERGVRLSALAGGLVSTTATTLALAGRTRQTPAASGLLGSAGILGNAVQLPKVLLFVWAVDQGLGRALAPVLLVGGVVAILVAVLSGRGAGERQAEDRLRFSNPYSVRTALRFGAIFVVVLFVLKAAEAMLGDHGILLASVLGGAASATAVALSVAGVAADGGLELGRAALAVLLGLTSNAMVKSFVSWSQGTHSFGVRVGTGLALALGASWAAWLFLG